MTAVTFTLNGMPITADVQPRTHLGDFLRDHRRLSGTHLGCEHGVCGACTVLLNGAPARSCITLTVACDGMDIKTIESFDDDAVMGDLRDAFTREHGLQCGFCTPGMLIASRDIVLRLPDADERRIREELSGNLCRCTGYVGIVNAVASVVEKRRSGGTAAPITATATAAPTLNTFTPRAQARAKTTTAPASVDDKAPQGWTRFEESFTIAQLRARVWELFSDIPRVAACLPGAEVLSQDGSTVKGRMTTKLGPIVASFSGSAVIERDDTNYTGSIAGAGSDGGSGSRTKGEVKYRLTPENGGTTTRVEVVVLYSLQGTLAQFSRSGLAQEFGRQLVRQFADNLSAQLGGGTVNYTVSSLNVGTLIWSSIRGWFGRLLGK